MPECRRSEEHHLAGEPLGADPARWEAWWHQSDSPELRAFKKSLDEELPPVRFSAADFAAWAKAKQAAIGNRELALELRDDHIRYVPTVIQHQVASGVERMVAGSGITTLWRKDGLYTWQHPGSQGRNVAKPVRVTAPPDAKFVLGWGIRWDVGTTSASTPPVFCGVGARHRPPTWAMTFLAMARNESQACLPSPRLGPASK